MFTGLVTAIGTITAATRSAEGLTCAIACPWDDLALGESVAVDGACLTVQRLLPGGFEVHVITTSLERTTFGDAAPGRRVNLERALRVGDRLGGHLVQGHVDGVGTVEATRTHGDAWLVDVRVPEAVWAVSVPLGSITVDGVSLTVNAMPAPGVIQLSLIPFTLEHTTLGARVAGDRVHLEGDTIGKYVAQQLRAQLERAR
ncbi:MAG: riboflavin synthase [Gemmatimonadales bacterium]|nr:riboflavin synthase [Gemmatimonadales bacterium]